MKTLIILEDERKVQPFVIAEMQAAIHEFDKLIIVTKELTSPLSTTMIDSSVEHIAVDEQIRNKYRLKATLSLFKPTDLTFIFKAITSGRLNKGFFNNLFLYELDSRAFVEAVSPVIESLDGEVFVLSCWFYCDALAAALLKKRYPKIRAFSLAHSFELDPIKNPFVDLSFNHLKHKYLDSVYFISYKMRDIYNRATNNRFASYSSEVTYLGCLKKEGGLNPSSDDHASFKICSCSNLIPIKNVTLIIEALRMWDKGEIEWTHFGAGPLYTEICDKSREVMNTNPLVKINLPGNTPNDDIHRYFASKHVDLFINVSKSEGVPVSLMEAIAYGIPIMATDVGGSSEIIEDGMGVLIRPDITPKDLCSTIEAYMYIYSKNAKEMRRAAHEFWQRKFNASINMAEFYKSLINKSYVRKS